MFPLIPKDSDSGKLPVGTVAGIHEFTFVQPAMQ
jgi:hypothetical protein